MDKNVVTIRDFSRNIYQYIKECRDIVVTIKGKKAFKVEFCRDNSANVVTNVTTNVVTIPTKQEVLKTLREQTSAILTNPIKDTEKHYCLACKKIDRKTIEAIGEFEVLDNGEFNKAWLCDRHRVRVAIGA